MLSVISTVGYGEPMNETESDQLAEPSEGRGKRTLRWSWVSGALALICCVTIGYQQWRQGGQQVRHAEAVTAIELVGGRVNYWRVEKPWVKPLPDCRFQGVLNF